MRKVYEKCFELGKTYYLLLNEMNSHWLCECQGWRVMMLYAFNFFTYWLSYHSHLIVILRRCNLWWYLATYRLLGMNGRMWSVRLWVEFFLSACEANGLGADQWKLAKIESNYIVERFINNCSDYRIAHYHAAILHSHWI